MRSLNKLNNPRVKELRDPAPLRRPGRIPWWLVALVIAALVGASALTWQMINQPQDIRDVALVGERSPAPIDVVVLLDESGSFSAYASVREEAIAQITQWAPQNLRPDDTITIVAFAQDAVVRLPTMDVQDIGAGSLPLVWDAVEGGSTSILPALAVAREALAPARTTTIITVTDTLVNDADASQINADMKSLQATTSTVIVPTSVRVESSWRDAWPWEKELSADPGSAGSTSLAFAEALAHATGQRVERR